jgi:antitoxin YqcF
MTEEISADNKYIAQTAAAAFGGEWQVSEHVNDDETLRIYVLSSPERPEPGLKSFSTVGLSDYPIPGSVQPPLGSEIVAVSNSTDFEAVIATAAFRVINSGWRVEPGNVFPNIIDRHFAGATAPHLLFVNPYLWDGLDSRALSGKTVAWLMGVPITEAEKLYRGEHGADALEDLFEQADPDFIDLQRASVV